MTRDPEPVASGSGASEIEVPILAAGHASIEARSDRIVVEEPLEIRVLVPGPAGLARHSVSVTMRTPGHDVELAAGFLVTEGIVSVREEIVAAAPCPSASGAAAGNVVNVSLAPNVPFDPARMSRNVYAASSCGICGKASLELIRAVAPRPPRGDFVLAPAWLAALSGLVRDAQAVFSRTGGLHAAALFEPGGGLRLLREDVGRHNAVDKVVGALLFAGGLPASDTLLWVSGRAGFELVQKAAVAGIPALAAVGAPSSLAVDVAREFGMTLIGFLRDGRFNLYAGSERVAGAPLPRLP